MRRVGREPTILISSTSGTITIDAPDVLGALIGKGAAYIVDQRDRGRHVEDAATLLASIDSIGDLDLTLNTNDRKRLRAISSALQDELHPAWLVLNAAEQIRGGRNLALLGAAAHL